MSQHAPTPGTGAPTGPAPLTGAPVDQPLDALVDGLVVVSATGLVLQANRAARESYGLQPFRSLPGALAHRWLEAQRAAHGERLVADVLLPLDSGQVVVSVSATRLAAAARTVLVLRDVTDEREQVDALSAFAGVVAHDLRGPIAAMVGWSETALDRLLDGPDTDPVEVAALVSRLHHGAQRLDRMVANLLLHATCRDRTLHPAPVDLAAVVEEVADARDVRRWVELLEVPKVSGDAPMLQHLMDNLVGNAVKFVAAGVEPHVVIGGRLDGPEVTVTVTDNGIGIPAGMREQVFQRFERVPGTGLGGTGMGLSICRTIVQRHGGAIRVDDGPEGVGTRFTVRLPAAA